MRSVIGLTIFLAFLPPSAASAQTLMQRLACTGDALRLCREFVPNHKLVANCMELNHSQLSPRCMVVFDAGMRASHGVVR